MPRALGEDREEASAPVIPYAAVEVRKRVAAEEDEEGDGGDDDECAHACSTGRMETGEDTSSGVHRQGTLME